MIEGATVTARRSSSQHARCVAQSRVSEPARCECKAEVRDSLSRKDANKTIVDDDLKRGLQHAWKAK